jgi:4,5-dihydroxyphthalate decarboxylase
MTSTLEKTRLYTLLGDYPNTMALKKAEVTSTLLDFDFADVKVPNTAFKPLVREARFDVGELAIVTYLQAKDCGKPYVLVPATVLGRGQHYTIVYNPQRGALSARDLTGKRVGVRAYTQTTGAWVRGFLSDDYGVDCAKVRWITFEDPHLAEYKDPDFVERAPEGKALVQMLLDGELDAAIVGDKIPDPRLALLIPDADTGRTSLGKNAWRCPDQPHDRHSRCNFEIATGPRARDLSCVVREPARGAPADGQPGRSPGVSELRPIAVRLRSSSTTASTRS